jgi:hypothetical protein
MLIKIIKLVSLRNDGVQSTVFSRLTKFNGRKRIDVFVKIVP